MGNTSPKCARGQFSETQFEKLKTSYELLAFKDTQLINEDTFVASFAGDGREKFGLELSMFLKSSCMSSCMHCTEYSVMHCKLVY